MSDCEAVCSAHRVWVVIFRKSITRLYLELKRLDQKRPRPGRRVESALGKPQKLRKALSTKGVGFCVPCIAARAWETLFCFVPEQFSARISVEVDLKTCV